MLHVAYTGGLRVSELVGLQLADLTLHAQPTIRVMGKGRRERILPLWTETATTIRDWIKVRGEPKGMALIENVRGDLMTRSGFKYMLAKHVKTPSAKQPSLAEKRVSPHTLRDTRAMHILHATGRSSKGRSMAGTRQPPKHGGLPSRRCYREVGGDGVAGSAQYSARPIPPAVQIAGDAAAQPIATLCAVQSGQNGMILRQTPVHSA